MRKRKWIPLKTKVILKVLKEVKGESNLPILVLVVGEEGVGKKSIIEKIVPDSRNRVASDEVFSVINFSTKNDLPKLTPRINEADLVLVVVDATKKMSDGIIGLLKHLKESKVPFLLIVNKIDVSEDLGIQLEPMSNYLEQFLPNVILTSVLKEINIGDKLIPTIVRCCEKKKLSFATRFQAFKLPVIKEIIKTTALQNAVIAGVSLYPGADLPILTTNQIRMILKIAAVYDRDISFSRAKEIVMVIGGGFTFRAIARELLSFLPTIGFLMKAAVAYGGTVAVGRTANKYFEKGISDLSAEEIRDIILETARELKVVQ